MRGTKARHAPTLLIDHDYGIRHKHSLQFRHEARQLRPVDDIAPEQDDSGGRQPLEQGSLFRC